MIVKTEESTKSWGKYYWSSIFFLTLKTNLIFVTAILYLSSCKLFAILHGEKIYLLICHTNYVFSPVRHVRWNYSLSWSWPAHTLRKIQQLSTKHSFRLHVMKNTIEILKKTHTSLLQSTCRAQRDAIH